MKLWYKKYRQATETSLKNLILQWLTVFFLIFSPATMTDNVFVGPTLDTSHERLAEHISKKWKIDYRLAIGYVIHGHHSLTPQITPRIVPPAKGTGRG